MDLFGKVKGDVAWFEVAQDRIQWQVSCDDSDALSGSVAAGNFLIDW